jgi:phosphoglycolate phosphatase
LFTKGLLFDLDGTLVDTLADLTDSMNAALTQLGRPARSADQCRQMIGYGLQRFAQEALGPEYMDLTDELMSRMVDYYKDHCVIKTKPYPGMEKVIAALLQKGLRLAVLTNKNQAPSETIIRHFFDDAFNPVVGAAAGREVKPDPQSTLDIITGWGLQKGEVLLVGDSETDIRTAAGVGLRCIACEWGFRTPDQLRQAGAQTLIRRPEQILDLLT